MLDEEAVFIAALDCATPAEREAYLAQACGGDRQRQARLQALLDAHSAAQTILDAPPPTTDLLLPDPAGDGTGEMVGPYKLLELIGEGAMGLVYMAQQEQPLRRKVALKIVKPGMDSRQVLARFEAERQALSLLDHPGIARVLDAGMAPSGRPYFVMELVRGIAINQFCDEAQLSTRQRLELFVRVCQAVQHAHEKGIIHRDLKPANILVTIHDDVPVPKVIDFGIAKAIQQRLVDQTLFTNFLQMIGTPAYMSPEQALLSSLEVDARSDIYSLGVLLYELLTGRTPFEQDRLRKLGYADVQRIIREEEPPRPSTRVATLGTGELSTVAARRSIDPRRYGRTLRGDLDWIVMRALEKDRNRRYTSAAELAADVRRHLEHHPVRAHRQSSRYRLQKFLRRHATQLLLSALCASVAAVSFAAYLLHQRHQTTQYESIRQLAYVGDIQRAALASQQGRLAATRHILERHRPQPGQQDHRGFEWHYLWGLCQAEPKVLNEHQAAVFDVVWSPSGRYMATSSGDLTVIVRNGVTGAPLKTLDGFARDVNSATFSADETVLAVAEETGEASFWEWRTGRLVSRLSDFEFHVAGIFFTPDPDIVVVTDVRWDHYMGAVSTWRLSTGERLAVRMGVRGLAVNPKTNSLLVGDSERGLRLLSIPELGDLGDLQSAIGHYSGAQFSSDGSLFAAVTKQGLMQLWEDRGEFVMTSHVHVLTTNRAVAMSPDSRLIAICGDDGMLRTWEVQNRHLHHQQHLLWTVPGTAWSCAFSPDGSQLAVARNGGFVEIYRTADLQPITRLVKQVANGSKVWAYSARRNQIAVTLSGASEVEVVDADSGVQVALIEGTPDHPLSALAFSPTGDSLWVGSSSGRIRRIALDSLAEVDSLESVPALNGMTISPDGRYLATSPDLTFWDTVSHTPHRRDRVNDGPTDGDHVITFASPTKPIVFLRIGSRFEMWNLEDPIQAPTMFRVQGEPVAATVSPDGSLLAIGTKGPAIHLWDVAAGEDRHVLFGHHFTPNQLAFSPDGKTLASSAWQEARLWNVTTGQELMQLPRQYGEAALLAFSSDGHKLIFVGPANLNDGIIVWDGVAESQAPGIDH